MDLLAVPWTAVHQPSLTVRTAEEVANGGRDPYSATKARAVHSFTFASIHTCAVSHFGRLNEDFPNVKNRTYSHSFPFMLSSEAVKEWES